jgi:hypothetical protein
MDDETNIKPLIPESSTSESTTVEVIMNDLRDKFVQIPDYQRDSDQWSEPTKSLLVESVINNLSIPAFFFEVSVDGGVERNQVIDGQQRLTTLFDFFQINSAWSIVKTLHTFHQTAFTTPGEPLTSCRRPINKPSKNTD